jgi:hypothetical protein
MSIKEITDTSEQEQESEDDQVKRLGKEITAKYCKKCKKSFIMRKIQSFFVTKNAKRVLSVA